jgi:hypothetical protein
MTAISMTSVSANSVRKAAAARQIANSSSLSTVAIGAVQRRLEVIGAA